MKTSNDIHYIKNKALQSPVSRHKVRPTFLHNWWAQTLIGGRLIRIFLPFLQELEEKTATDRDQVISSTLIHSNSELNSICPHKGSTKSEF